MNTMLNFWYFLESELIEKNIHESGEGVPAQAIEVNFKSWKIAQEDHFSSNNDETELSSEAHLWQQK